MSSQFINFSRNSNSSFAGSTNFKKYLKETFHKHPVLTKEEEKRLTDMAKNPALSTKERDAAKTAVLMSNMKFFYKVAREYAQKFPDLNIEDLLQEIYIAADKAFSKFKPDYNTRFTGWAVGYFKNAMRDYARRNLKSVKIPAPTFSRTKRFSDMVTEGSKDEAKKNMDVSEYDASSLEGNSIKDSRINPTDYRIDVNEEPDSMIISTGISLQEEQNDAKDRLKEIITALDPDEKKILYLYYGIGCEVHTIQAISKELNMRRFKVSSVINSSLRKMRKKAQESNIE